MDPASAHAGLSTAKAAIGVAVIMAGATAYLSAAGALGIEPYYMGFLFALHFGAFEKMNPRLFVPALLGAFTGIANAGALALLPALLGPTPGLVIATGITLFGTFCLLKGWFRSVVNTGYLLFLTVATIPALQAPPSFLGMAAAVCLGAVFMGAVVLIGGAMARRAAKAASVV